MERPAEVSPGLWLFPRIMARVLSLPLHSARGLVWLTNHGSPLPVLLGEGCTASHPSGSLDSLPLPDPQRTCVPDQANPPTPGPMQLPQFLPVCPPSYLELLPPGAVAFPMLWTAPSLAISPPATFGTLSVGTITVPHVGLVGGSQGCEVDPVPGWLWGSALWKGSPGHSNAGRAPRGEWR